ncbi:hypothetical protein CI109_100535 [Kwoniella shandongensis]|uniref:Uncharacterized protein n=1 Tax=Kwoniella shandongensis TaxID=1734106 RepID=A0A5M6C439_9TREE|nr:uncharacterized protein CI109_003544 [Kwoniella shandongensis]KAA5528255.1 hypothetical protein CI109_003544 [Kwoniella shandongensis]
MAITSPPPRGGNRRDDVHDPVLEKVASTNTFDSDWPTLRHHFQLALLSTLSVFLSKGPPRPYRPPHSPSAPGLDLTSSKTEGGSPSHGSAEAAEDGKPPSESLLLSPSQPTSSLDASTTPNDSTTRPSMTPRSVDVEPSESPSHSRMDSLHNGDDLQPSTPGGLVIPPFPPLDRSRRRRSSSATPGPGEGPGPSAPPAGLSPRMNGMGGHHQQQQRIMALGVGVTNYEEDYDEDVAIGGKRLPGWIDEEEGKKEIDRLVKLLEEMDSPPFTIQRLAELLLQPTLYHTSLGKFLRAIEKGLLVTTPWEPPSYSYVAPAAISSGRSIIGGSTSSDSGYDTDSTMPPGSSTPMFSPIPFLSHPDSELLGGEPGANGQHRGLDDGLMSPLMLGGESTMGGGEGFGFGGSSTSNAAAGSSNARSPTPEPEDDDGDTEMASATEGESSSPTAIAGEIPPRPEPAQGQYTSTEHTDPAHQSYLGRVDELDTGPITSSPIKEEDGSNSPVAKRNGHGGSEEVPPPTTGTGEGGNMAPHGMSEKPVPISSTTVVKDDKREIAGLRRSASEKTLLERFVSAAKEEEGTEGDEVKAEEADGETK